MCFIDPDVDTQQLLAMASAVVRERFGIHECTFQMEHYVPEMGDCSQCQQPANWWCCDWCLLINTALMMLITSLHSALKMQFVTPGQRPPLLQLPSAPLPATTGLITLITGTVSWSWSAGTQHHVNPGELNWIFPADIHPPQVLPQPSPNSPQTPVVGEAPRSQNFLLIVGRPHFSYAKVQGLSCHVIE